MGPNPKLYRSLCEPFASNNELNESLGEFFKDVEAARERHKLRDVTIIVNASYLSAEGDESEGMAHLYLGDSRRAEGMAAWALGREQAIRQDTIGGILKGPIEDRRRRP